MRKKNRAARGKHFKVLKHSPCRGRNFDLTKTIKMFHFSFPIKYTLLYKLISSLKIQLFIIFLKVNDERRHLFCDFVISESEASILDAVKSAAPVRKSLRKMPREANSSTLLVFVDKFSEKFVSRDVDSEHNIKHV